MQILDAHLRPARGSLPAGMLGRTLSLWGNQSPPLSMGSGSLHWIEVSRPPMAALHHGVFLQVPYTLTGSNHEIEGVLARSPYLIVLE